MAVFLAFGSGIATDRVVDASLQVWFASGVIAATTGLMAVNRLARCPDARRVPWIFAVLVWGSLFSLGAAWHHIRWNDFRDTDVGFFAREVSQPACVVARVCQFPRVIRPDSDELGGRPLDEFSEFLVRVSRIRDGQDWRVATGRLRVRVGDAKIDLVPGEQIEIVGQLKRCSPEMNQGGFSLYEYRRSHRELATFWVDGRMAVKVLQSADRWAPQYWVAHLRHFGHRVLWQYLPEDKAVLSGALLLGEREYLTRSRTDAFFHTGTIHLLAISGLHVTILAMGLYLLARVGFLPLRWSLVLVMAMTLTYAFVSGFRPPVIRATILVFVFCIGTLIRRDVPGFNALAAAAIIVLILNPCELFRIGAQLSFLAVAAMMWYVPLLTKPRVLTPLERLVARKRSYTEVLLRLGCRRIWQSVIASTMIWLITLPLISYQFHLCSPIALILNAFLWIPVATGLLSGMGVIVLGDLCPPIARLASGVCCGSLGALERCVTAVEPLPGSYFWVAGSSLFFVAAFYAILFVGSIARCLRPFAAIWFLFAYAVFGCGVVAPSSWLRGSSPAMECTFLSVGHGSCVVLHFPDDTVWLYDAGSLVGSRRSAMVVSQFLWHHQIKKIDAIIVSHADIDHFNAVPNLLERFPVAKVYVWPGMFASSEPSLDHLRRALLKHHIPTRPLVAGDVIERAGVEIRVLHPWSNRSESNDNANSVVLELRYQGEVILLTGDIEESGLDRLLMLPGIQADLALAPHHGSLRSRPVEFARWCRASDIVVSRHGAGGRDAGTEAYRKAGCRVLHTGIVGSITARIENGAITVTTLRPADRDGTSINVSQTDCKLD